MFCHVILLTFIEVLILPVISALADNPAFSTLLLHNPTYENLKLSVYTLLFSSSIHEKIVQINLMSFQYLGEIRRRTLDVALQNKCRSTIVVCYFLS